ncbi:MAG: amidase [Deltaproteobacteria bacterium]|nr:amidase [Deltaproteobacteria bacterium]
MDERELEKLTISQLSREISSGAQSPVALTRLVLARIERLNPVLNAYAMVMKDQAFAAAEQAHREIAAGQYRGPLHGIPISIKDNIAVAGVRTTAGSKTLSDWKPDHDATVVSRLREAGAVILGKTHMHEWAKSSHTNNVFYGPSRNPWDVTRATGGSSGGSAAAVAASLGLASIGTDSAGSVRNPAALCGIAGLKATHGRVSLSGGVPGTGPGSINHFGVLAKTVEDCALVLNCIAGADPRDPYCAEVPMPDYTRGLSGGADGLRVGLVRGYFDALMFDEVRQVFDEAVRFLGSLGVETEEVEIPHMELLPAVQVCIARVEDMPDHDRYLRTRPRDYSPGMLRNLIGSLLISGSAVNTAHRVRRLIYEGFERAFERVRVMVVPTISFPAPTIEELDRGSARIDGREVRLSDRRGNLFTLCTIPFNQTGLPALSVCCGFSASGLPIGMQIVGRPFDEETVLRVGHAYERAAGWYKKTPDLPAGR